MPYRNSIWNWKMAFLMCSIQVRWSKKALSGFLWIRNPCTEDNTKSISIFWHCSGMEWWFRFYRWMLPALSKIRIFNGSIQLLAVCLLNWLPDRRLAGANQLTFHIVCVYIGTPLNVAFGVCTARQLNVHSRSPTLTYHLSQVITSTHHKSIIQTGSAEFELILDVNYSQS